MQNYEFKITEEMQDLIDTSITEQDKLNVYPRLVSEFVRQKYSQDKVEAILNNYMAEPEKHSTEFTELQEYRKACKEYAKGLLRLS